MLQFLEKPHISVIYPEELAILPPIDAIGRQFDFSIDRYFKANLGAKTYFGCTIESPQLINLRLNIGLGDALNFRGYVVPLHFTIAVLK